STIPLRDEFGVDKDWDKFVQFPSELGELFPGSYVSPELFLGRLGYPEDIKGAKKSILSVNEGRAEDPTFSFSSDNFSVHIMNGMFNPHALTMSRLAKEVSNDKEYPKGFADDKAEPIRAQYQNAMLKNIAQELKKPVDITRKPAVRIHDDCSASGDSIIGYLYDRVQDEGELKKLQERGVDIVIDGAATAQSILYFQAFAKAYNIPIDITAGHMAFQLSPGEPVEGSSRLKHANYLEYPPKSETDFYKDVDPESQAEIFNLGETAVAVHGDMGEAEKGISAQGMEKIREPFKHEGIDNYCEWNDKREDDHGNHPNSDKGITIVPKVGEDTTDYVYFARGGYLPYMLDLMNVLNQEGVNDTANVVIIRLSRLTAVNLNTSTELGYGAGFTKASCVKYVS
ncbi:MAG: hypothetical protein NTZ55_03020, partial [Candidatus Roizmanbacteria bacterium]|nr:hypothetical protein [Candidatus Roizmanbacteria bacterium]